MPLLCLLGIIVFSSCAGTNAGISGIKEPDWVRDPYTKYSKQANVAAVGSGNSREAAEKSAFANLVAIFGQSIQVDEKVYTSYQEAIKNGAANWSENTAINTDIATSAGMDSLVGAEIGGVWDDGKSHYALAFLNKAKAAQIYSGMIDSNQALIDLLLDIPQAEKNTLAALARYQFAATISDISLSYLNLLLVIGGPVHTLKSGSDYRLEAANITKAIPVGLSVQNDKSGRIQGAFARALSELGFSSGGNNSTYIIEVNITTTPVEIANNNNIFTRIELVANLTDSGTGMVLLPFYYNSREGHISQAEADNRAYAAAERKINEEYVKNFNGYLSRLLAKN